MSVVQIPAASSLIVIVSSVALNSILFYIDIDPCRSESGTEPFTIRLPGLKCIVDELPDSVPRFVIHRGEQSQHTNVWTNYDTVDGGIASGHGANPLCSGDGDKEGNRKI